MAPGAPEGCILNVSGGFQISQTKAGIDGVPESRLGSAIPQTAIRATLGHWHAISWPDANLP
eukprot:12894914-Alexandrium_andersonii.AAC.1